MAKCKILFLAANPSNTETLRLDEEIREIQTEIRMSDLRESLQFVVRVAVRRRDLQRALNEEKPDIVHFSGHGSKEGEIMLENDQKTVQPVSKDDLGELFRVSNDDNNIKLVILNACYSQPQASEIIKFVDLAIGMSREIPDQDARMFAASFYSALGFGKSVQNAFDQGKLAILGTGELKLGSKSSLLERGLSFGDSKVSQVSELAVPQLLVRDGCDPKAIRLVAPRLGWKELVLAFAFATPIVFLVFALVWPILLKWWVIAVSVILPIATFEIAKRLRVSFGFVKRLYFYSPLAAVTLLAVLRFSLLPRDLVGQIEIDVKPATSGTVTMIEEGKQNEPSEIKENGQFVLRVPNWKSINEKIKLRIEVTAPKIANEEQLEISISQLNNIRLKSALPKVVLDLKQFAQDIRVQMHNGEIQDYVGRQLRLKFVLKENSDSNFVTISEWGNVDEKSYKVQFDFLSTTDRLANLKKGSEVRIKGKVEKQVPLDSNQMRIDLNECEVLEE